MHYSICELGTVTPGSDKAEASRAAIIAAQDAERFGYRRFWFAEHPGSRGYLSQESVPLIAAAAGRTSRIRLGSGAALTRHHSAFSLSERFAVLEALAPGRIDLGLGRSSGTFPIIDIAMRRHRNTEPPDDFSDYLREVVGHLHGAFPVQHPFASIRLTNGLDSTPSIWVLGSSGYAAALAGKLGVGYAFGAQINPAPFIDALQAYRENFAPTPFGTGRPQAMLALNIVAADDEQQAHRLTWPARAMRARGEDRPIPTLRQAESELGVAEKTAPSTVEGLTIPSHISGTPETLRQQLEPLVRASGATEIIVQDMISDRDLQQRSRELISQALAPIAA